MKRVLTLLCFALACGLSPAAWATSGVTAVVSDGGTAQGTPMATIGSCTAGQVAIAFVGNNSSRTNNSVTDSTGLNTWTAGTEAVQGTFRVRSFRSILAASIVGGSTTITANLSAAATPHVSVQCRTASTGIDTQGADNGGPGLSSYVAPSGPSTQAADMVLAVFMGNRWNVATGPGGSWTLDGDTTGGAAFGIKVYSQPVASSASPTATFGSLSATTALSVWIDATGAATATAHSLLLRGAGR